MSNLEEVKDWIISEVWPEIVKSGKLCKKCTKSSDEGSFKLKDVLVTPIGYEEAFMLTNCFRIQIDYSCKNDEKESLHLIAKRTPTTLTPENYEALDFGALFGNEHLAYSQIIPRLMQLSNRDESENNLPTYYYSKICDTSASMVLGDFKQQGFRLCPDRINLSLEHILLSVEHIAFFHGLCYALKYTDREEFDHIVSMTKDSRYSKTPSEQILGLNFITGKKLKHAIDKYCPEVPIDFQEKLYAILSDLYYYSKHIVQPVEPFATLIHGDYLRNNIAYAYDDLENPTVPKKAMMFDFQTLRYSSPMVDLTTFLTISAGTDVRTKHFDEIFDKYHKTLTSTFAEMSKLPVPDFMSRSSMLKEYIRYLVYSIGIAGFFLPAMHEPTNMYSDLLAGDNDQEKFLRMFMALGGEPLDRELAFLQKELYDFMVQENVNIFDDSWKKE